MNKKALLKVLALSVFSSALFLSGCQILKPKVPEPPKVIAGFSSPESVIAGPNSERFYVSNVGEKLEPLARDGDGYISEVSPDGTVLNKRFLPKEGVLNAPKGMAVIGKVLYVTDIDRVVGFELTTRDKVFELDFSPEKTLFLNDLAALDDNTLFVSATDTGRIYRISLGGNPSFSLLKDNLPGANGLAMDRQTNKLYVVTFGEPVSKGNGEAGVIDLNTNAYQRLTPSIGFLDGVELLPDGRLIFSDWVSFKDPGKLRVYDVNTKELSEIRLSEEVRGPADFYFDGNTRRLWMPKMMEGKVLVEGIK